MQLGHVRDKLASGENAKEITVDTNPNAVRTASMRDHLLMRLRLDGVASAGFVAMSTLFVGMLPSSV